jgi:succinate dehydrogenase / fumarate reductase, cytochrome b subunit
MSTTRTARVPQTYRRSGWSRIVEGLRYGGGIGQWSWLLHRVTGLGILFFLIIHILDTFFVVAWPAEYDWTVDLYGGVVSGTYYVPLRWAFRAAELGLIACVVFHAVNGLRIVWFDFWPESAEHQKIAFRVATIVFVLIMIPVTWVVLSALADTPGHLTH